MKLSRVERWMLSNQYRVLGLLDPKEAEGYAQLREALGKRFRGGIRERLRACVHRQEWTDGGRVRGGAEYHCDVSDS